MPIDLPVIDAFLNKPARNFFSAVAVCLLLPISAWLLPQHHEPETVTSVPSRAIEIERTRATQEEEASAGIPEPRSEYMGRVIAQTMHFSGAEWLIRDDREREERCSLLLTNLGLKPGHVVCDMGCGNGFYALQIAQMIGDRGRVLGVDVQSEMLELLRTRMEREKIDNVTPILGSYHDPRLPDESCDLILLVDVYHEFSYPELMLAAMRKALKPKGRIALVEYRTEDPDVPIKRLHKMSKKQILKEYEPNGFRLVQEFDELPWQHVMFFEKDEQD